MAWSGTALTSPSVGTPVTAAQGTAIAVDLNVFTTGAVWTPTWRSTGTQPAIGNGTTQGFYIQAGKMLMGQAVIVLGSTSTVGTAVYTWDLPTAISASYTASSPIGYLSLLDASAGTAYTRILLSVTSTTCAAFDPSGVSASATSPVVPANGDRYVLNLNYITA